MLCDKDERNVFTLYKYGVPRGGVILNSDGVLVQKRNLFTDEWTDFSSFDGADTALFEFPLEEIAGHMPEFEALTDEDGAKLTLESGAVYHRYIEIEGKVLGESAVGQIWVQRGVKNPLDVVVCSGKVVGFIRMRRDGCLVLVSKGYEAVTPLQAYDDPILSPAVHPVRHVGAFSAEMRDGVKLATEVYLPGDLRDGETVPAILIRTPYGRLDFVDPELRFVFRGYALVAQDCRGRGDSEGEWLPNFHERKDGSDTLDWIADQSWSNGRVGMIGGSYGGYVQWAAAASGNPHLQAAVSQVTSGSPFIDNPRKGGTLMSGMLAWCLLVSERTASPELMDRDDWGEVALYRPVKDIPEKKFGRKIAFWDSWISHSDYDDFWKECDWSRYGNKVSVPALIVSGWYDDDGQGSSEAWDMLKEQGRDDAHIILGPWYHKANTTRDIHNISFGDNAIFYDMDINYLRWFDHYLKDIDNGIDRTPRANYYLVGANQWKEADEWPPRNSQLTPLYMHSEGKLSFNAPRGSEKPDTYVFNPDDPAPHLIDISENELNVPENYREVEKRSDILLYTTDPLDEDIAIAGDIYARLYAATSARDTDWVVRVTDVDDEGNAIRVADAILRARYRNGFDRPKLLEPGAVEKYELRLTRIGYVFKKGHHIRLQVTSGAKNLAFPNCNTGEDPTFAVKFVSATQTIYHDEKYSSFVELPVLK